MYENRSPNFGGHGPIPRGNATVWTQPQIFSGDLHRKIIPLYNIGSDANCYLTSGHDGGFVKLFHCYQSEGRGVRGLFQWRGLDRTNLEHSDVVDQNVQSTNLLDRRVMQPCCQLCDNCERSFCIGLCCPTDHEDWKTGAYHTSSQGAALVTSSTAHWLQASCSCVQGVRYTASFHGTWVKIVSSWPTSAADHCDRLMSWRVPQEEHERVSATGVFPSLDRVSGTLCLLHYVTETSHLYSLRDFWRHFCLFRAAAHSACCFFASCINILTYLLTYLLTLLRISSSGVVLSSLSLFIPIF